ncbi:hypothetical protein TEA_018172 [Camellia sinensis var. sinensis]|uniref:PITH domain-containing protein n=1 Tax=Camellia sinensis var. sinensis TaxID=542762 RepID=A0A4S4D1Z5_CAMSN|nr:hypothetical protein TEA_018172 [Camellia sinensis var. sinensis]
MREQGTLVSWHCRILSGQAELPAEFYTLWVYSDDSPFTVKFTESKGITKPVRGKGLMNLNSVRVWGNSTSISLIQPKEGHPTLFLVNSTTGEVNKNIRDPPTKARVKYGIHNENEAVISFGMGDEGGDLYIGKVVEQDWTCLYSLKKKRWSNISVFPDKSPQVSGCGVFLKNKIHWLVSRETDLTPVIVAMSLQGDFVEILVPEEAASGPYTLACFDSCLCLMHYDDNISGEEEQGHRSFWVLEDYSDISSLAMECTFKAHSQRSVHLHLCSYSKQGVCSVASLQVAVLFWFGLFLDWLALSALGCYALLAVFWLGLNSGWSFDLVWVLVEFLNTGSVAWRCKKEDLGMISLGILYSSFTVFSLVAALVVRFLGLKNALILGTTEYWLFIAVNLIPTCIMGTPDATTWPGVTSLPDYIPDDFPKQDPKVSALNEAVPGSVKSVFKAWEQRLNISEGHLESNEGDPELLVFIPFTSDVKIKSISVVGGADGTSPSKMRAFINREGIDFSDAQNMQSIQEWDLVENLQGVLEYQTKYSRFQGVGNLTLHFPENFGGDATQIHYIGLKGEATQLKRDVVATIVYELMPNPSDHKQEDPYYATHYVVPHGTTLPMRFLENYAQVRKSLCSTVQHSMWRKHMAHASHEILEIQTIRYLSYIRRACNRGLEFERYHDEAKKLAARLNEYGVLPEFGSLAPEHPSPVSVLDDTKYRDDALSPVKQMPDVLKGSALLYRDYLV